MELIGVYDNTLTKDFCEDIIKIFEESEFKKPGETMAGLRIETKNTLDLHFKFCDKDVITKYDTELVKILNKYIIKYLSSFIRTGIDLNDGFSDKGFQIQKYKKNEGFYKYHVDSYLNFDDKNYRLITFIFYLNDVNEGGETEFFGNYKIKPEQGKLVLFPACWCFPHCGLMPASNDKYILTGWFYVTETKPYYES